MHSAKDLPKCLISDTVYVWIISYPNFDANTYISMQWFVANRFLNLILELNEKRYATNQRLAARAI